MALSEAYTLAGVLRASVTADVTSTDGSKLYTRPKSEIVPVVAAEGEIDGPHRTPV
jgi:hypothetical protein